MSTLLTFRTGTGINSYVVHVSNDDRFPQTISTTTGTSWYVATGASCWIDTISYKSGYSGARAKCSANGNDWSLSSDKYVGTSTTRDITVYATGGSSGYDTNALYFRAGTGVKSYKMIYDGKSETDIVSGSIGSTTVGLFVRDGTDAVVSTIVCEDGYKGPYRFVEYTSSAYSTVKKNFAEDDFYVRSNGTRYLKLTATYAPTYWYQMHADANGGSFSGGSTIWSSAVLSTSGSGGAVNYAVSNFPTPSRGGYTFVGWGASRTATTTYGSSVSFVTSAIDSDNPKSVTVYAIWKKTEFTCHIKIGAGINSASVYVDGALKSDIRDKVYHDIIVSYDSTITVKSIAKATGYTRPYKFNFYQNSASTVPTSTLERDTDEPSYAYSDSRFYAEIVATKSSIDLFYWNTAGTDASLFAAGKPISNLTAARWNKLKAKIKELAEASGASYSYTEVSKGSAITAAEFNSVRTAIGNRTGHGTLPPAQSKGDPILASLFEGSASLKSALNAAITYYNNG